MKRYLVLLVVVILAAGVFLFEEQHRAATVAHHIANLIAPPKSEAPRLESSPVAQGNNFADYTDLWGNPWKNNTDPDFVYSSLAFQKDLATPALDKILARPDLKTEPVLTVQDREAAFAIFSAAGFRLTFNLKPVYATPDALDPSHLMPSHIDPGIGGSFSF
ncbi:MAG TPA: hypothetical protein VGF90_04750 [Verrucomicrobiae bacterium]